MRAAALRRPRTIALLVILLLLLSSQVAYQASAQTAGGPVEGALQGAFQVTAGGVDAPDTAFTDYAGEPLTVQAVEVGRRAAEPTMGVTTDGSAFYAASTFDSTVTGARTELLRSTDDGITWESVQMTVPAIQSFPPSSLDPYAYVDTGTDRIFNLDLTGCGTLQYSDDNGETFVAREAACGDSVDHQSLFGGPPSPNSALPQLGYPNTLYYCSNRVADSSCARSLDGGDTWVTGATPAYPGAFDPAEGGICNGLHGHGIVDPEGRAVLPKGHCGFPYVSVSDDGGDTWTRTRVSDTVMSGEILIPPFEYAGTYAHTSVASDSAGNLYYVWPGQDRRAYLAVSRDHGATWSEAVNVTPPGVTEVNFPTVTAGAEGEIAVLLVGGFAEEPPGALGSEAGDEAAQKRPWNHYVMASENALESEPLFVLTTTHDPADPIHRGDCYSRCGGMFDFLDVIVAPTGDIWATSSDTCVQPECLGEEAERDPDQVGVGIAIRQLSGPDLLDPVEAPLPTGTPVPTATPSPTATPPAPTPAPTQSPTTAPSSTATPTASGTPTAEPDPERVQRISGATRVETAISLSVEAFDRAATAVLARADDFPDALAAAALAAELDAPVLLTPTAGLEPAVGAELERLGTTEVVLMGGTAALSPQVERDLEAREIGHRRVGGADRFATAALIADQIVAEGGAVDQAIIALGDRPDGGDAWPDALSAGTLSTAGRAPILLALPDQLPEATTQALDRLLDGGDTVFVSGGPQAVGEGPERALGDAGYLPQRLAGADRYGTSVAVIAEARRQGADLEPVLLASGAVFADALVAGPAAHQLGGALLLVDPADVDASAATRDLLAENAEEIDTVLIVGGPSAISDAVRTRVETLIRDG